MHTLVSSLGASPRSLVAPEVRRKDPLSSVVFVDEAYDTVGEHLMYASVSILMEEFPTGTDSSLTTIDATQDNLQLTVVNLLKMSEVRPEGRMRDGNSRERAYVLNRQDSVRNVLATPISMAEGIPVDRQGRFG